VVKRVAGGLVQGRIDASVPTRPHRDWIYREVLRAIEEGALRPGERLPAARTLAREWSVARGAVDDAFARLQIEGLLERRIGDGSYVAQSLPGGLQRRREPALTREPSRAVQRVLQRLEPMMAGAETINVNRPVAGPMLLHPGMVDIDSFPLPLWRRAMQRAYGDGQRANLNYGSSAGLPALREATARYLALTRGLRCEADQVLILHSPTQVLELIARVLLEPGDTVCIEEPTFSGVPRIFALAHLNVACAPIDADGFDPARAEAACPRPAAIYLNPLNQYPTGLWTQPRRRQALLDWAGRCGAWVIESDYVNDIVFEGSQPTPLQRLDGDERVLFTGGYNMLMFPTLRINYLVLPRRLVRVFAAVRGMFGDHTNVPHQVAMTWFLEGGHFSQRVRQLRDLYLKRAAVLQDAVATRLPAGLRLHPIRGGGSACLPLPARWPDLRVVESLVPLGVGAEPLSTHGWCGSGGNGLALGIGNVDPTRIGEAVGHIARVLHELG
jgi:GntR family transcriptional regulator / MocR family aminotransferase